MEEEKQPVLVGGSLVSSILNQGSARSEFKLEESIQRVQKKCENLKLEVIEFLKQNYDEFLLHANSVVDLEQKVKEAIIEYQRLKALIEDDLKGRLAKSAGKREEMERRYKETQIKITFVQSLVEIHTKIEQCQREIKKEQFSRAAELVIAVGELIKLIANIGCEAKVFMALKSQLALVESDLKCELLEQWNMCIKWKPNPLVGVVDATTASELSHSIPCSSGHFEGVVKAMRILLSKAEWQERVKKYAIKLLNGIIKPLLTERKLKIILTHPTEDTTHLTFAVTDSVTIEEILNSLFQVIDSTHKIMPVNERDEWMRLLSESIEPDLSNLLIKGVLSPNASTERDEYTAIMRCVTEFEENMKSVGFVESNYSTLTDYMANVDVHLTVHQCQELLGNARSILMRPLHDTVLITPKDTQEVLDKLQLLEQFKKCDDKQEVVQVTDKELDIQSFTFAFPQCLVSKTTKEFVDLVHDTLMKCTTVSDSTATKLYYCCRNMIQLFIAVSQSYHKESVLQLPRNAALQHNNYMYVAHNLITLGYQFHLKLPKGLASTGVTFIDYVPQLRRLGEDCFLSEMERQCIDIVEFLRPVQSFEDIGESSAKQEDISRGMKQGFLQIYRLSKIYSEVLPVDLAKHCKGGLLNILVKEIISRMFSMVDISVSDASFMYNFIKQDVLEKGPVALSLNQEEVMELSKICSSWERLKELAFVLDAEQEDIVIRWKNGTLSKHMSTTEVKHLVRALFKNTDRRANTLSKII